MDFVKPLVWEENRRPREKECHNWFSDTPIGSYWIEKKNKYHISSDGAGEWRGYYDGLDAAKAAAQSSHTKRVIACISAPVNLDDARHYVECNTAIDSVDIVEALAIELWARIKAANDLGFNK